MKNGTMAMHNDDDSNQRVCNFSAGPCCLPVEVLREAQESLLNCNDSGMSVMEMSHRSKEFLEIFRTTKHSLENLIGIPPNYRLLFMHGGGSQQFAAVPLNLLPAVGAPADYVLTGSWSEKAYSEGSKYATATKVCDAKANGYSFIPPESQWLTRSDATYLHYCSNETIHGLEFKHTPSVSVPLVCDMSSQFCSKPIEVEKHALIYAGVQKNLGPASAAVVIAREDYCSGKGLDICPSVCSYKVTADNDSMYNTPPCFTIYMIGLMAKYIKRKGGLKAIQEFSEQKARRLYDVIDSSDGYYSTPVKKDFRSNMNVPFRVGCSSEALEKKFLVEAERKGLIALGGHRSVGGCRASLYNGMEMKGVERLTSFMKEFQEDNPVQQV